MIGRSCGFVRAVAPGRRGGPIFISDGRFPEQGCAHCGRAGSLESAWDAPYSWVPCPIHPPASTCSFPSSACMRVSFAMATLLRTGCLPSVALPVKCQNYHSLVTCPCAKHQKSSLFLNSRAVSDYDYYMPHAEKKLMGIFIYERCGRRARRRPYPLMTAIGRNLKAFLLMPASWHVSTTWRERAW
jgi:hypothetical protein